MASRPWAELGPGSTCLPRAEQPPWGPLRRLVAAARSRECPEGTGPPALAQVEAMALSAAPEKQCSCGGQQWPQPPPAPARLGVQPRPQPSTEMPLTRLAMAVCCSDGGKAQDASPGQEARAEDWE